MKEIAIILHTVNGNVCTTYPVAMEKEAYNLILDYTLCKKNFSVEFHG